MGRDSVNKPATGQPITADFSRAGTRRRIKKRPRQNVTAAESSASQASNAHNRRAEDWLKHVEGESVVDNEKVRKIKAAISAGTYVVDANNIAQKLMDLEIELTKPSKDT